jgi:hypothetical protein
MTTVSYMSATNVHREYVRVTLVDDLGWMVARMRVAERPRPS